MYIDISKRGTGKTTRLIKRSANTGITIVTPNSSAAQNVKLTASELGVTIPEPISIQEILSGNAKGREIYDTGVLIDDIEHCFQFPLMITDIEIPIRGFTASRY